MFTYSFFILIGSPKADTRKRVHRSNCNKIISVIRSRFLLLEEENFYLWIIIFAEREDDTRDRAEMQMRRMVSYCIICNYCVIPIDSISQYCNWNSYTSYTSIILVITGWFQSMFLSTLAVYPHLHLDCIDHAEFE